MKWTCKAFEDLSAVEVYELGFLRQEVFVVEQESPYLDFDRIDYKCYHLMAHNEAGDLVAYARLVPVDVSYSGDVSIGRVVNSKLVRGQGMGKLLMQKAIAICQELWGAVDIRISAQDYLLRFYGNLGFIPTNKKYLEDGIPHTQMYMPLAPVSKD